MSLVDAIVIGASLGGLHACRVIFSGLGAQSQPFLVLAQHRHATSPNWLVPLLQSHTDLTVVEASDKCVPQKGHLYVAPADYHLLLGAEGFELSVDPPVLYARPSIDVLFESAADTYGEHLMAVILTGSSSDGAKGAARVKRAGGKVLVQNPQTAESPECPASVLKETSVDGVFDLPELAMALAETCRTGRTPRALPPQV